jgi:hypothetical protein
MERLAEARASRAREQITKLENELAALGRRIGWPAFEGEKRSQMNELRKQLGQFQDELSLAELDRARAHLNVRRNE